MFLSDKDLKILAREYNVVSPFVEENCEGATINLTLDPQVKRDISQKNHVMGNKQEDMNYETIDLQEQEFFLEPNESVLVQAYEYFKIPTNMAAVIFERYSIKLLGLVVSPASYMNPGYQGRLSFLVTNHSKNPVGLVAGIKFCQLSIAELTSEAEKPYGKQDAKYMGGKEVHISKLHLDKEIQLYLQENGLNTVSGVEARQMGSHLLSKMDENAQKYVDMIREKIGGFNESTS